MSRSKSAHDLSGLMKYADHAPWDEALAEMLSAHLDPASEATGLEPDGSVANSDTVSKIGLMYCQGQLR